jgi:phage-related protein
MRPWTSRQFGSVIDRFKAECPPDAWDDVLLRYAVLRERGPTCGNLVAKKLKGANGIWELLGHADNYQPRPLFYFRETSREIVFVHAFMKKGKQDYQPAIRLAQQRRKLIELGEKPRNVIPAFEPTRH